MQDMLSTFQKHIGSQFETPLGTFNANSIHKFGEDIKGANEFIGALQSTSVALRKILKIAYNTSAQDMQNIKVSIQEIVDNASFMGVGLFETRLDTTLNNTQYSFIVQNPLPLCKVIESQVNMGEVVSYVEEKLQEISQMLITLSDVLTEPNPPEFNPAQFAAMFKAK
ncbi:flagellar FLiS export co-chaperone [Helicobacter typhlonius]|uniref:flagellar FLiS export co-chaperone n=1 Tax=Helicobacter typhlonius TaxID=76936 RepID=UPI002FE312F4